MTPLVELRDVSVSFGATRALDGVSFDVRAGEVHVLAGENGAGKSTLIRVLSGVIRGHAGEVLVGGRRVRLRDARDARAHGVATIHQELSLVGSMTVADNLALATPGSMLAWSSPSASLRVARRALAEMELDVDPRALVETLPLAERQLLEIGRALAGDARVLILDEPTSALSEPEAERLLARVERLAEAGKGVVYVSHRMEENDRLADRVTVLRDGRVVASRSAEGFGRDELVRLMMGRDEEAAPRDAPGGGAAEEAALDVRDLRVEAPGAAPLAGVSFHARRGEIVGLAGLRGSGVSEVLAALFGVFGAARVRAEVRVAGRPYVIESPARSIAQGVVYLANDRRETVLYDLDVVENVSLSSLAAVARGGVVARRREARLAEQMTAKLRVAMPSLRAPARALSGGNQQKVALLRCLAAKPSVLLLDEPTRGVDVGAKAEIHRALRAIAAEGAAVVMVGSELVELLDLCDRVVVLARGRVAATVPRKDLTREALRLSLDAPG